MIKELDNESDLYEEDIEKSKDNIIPFLKISNYPVQISIMEHMKDTLDQLLDDGYNMSEIEWLGVLFQITFGLSVAQKYYKFCHNDLHSSNVMFQSTKEKYLYFHTNNTYYRIPTFNKIAKIIDFARATFKYNDVAFFSDVFDVGGDAEDQYTHPNNKQHRYNKHNTAPNPSFDLVRFAATIEERLVDRPKILKLINKWMTDDHGDNVNQYDDDFSLYVRISKDCHNAVPREVIKDAAFKCFKVKKENIPKGKYIYFM
jgi:thiamine kinase-like enzyme